MEATETTFDAASGGKIVQTLLVGPDYDPGYDPLTEYPLTSVLVTSAVLPDTATADDIKKAATGQLLDAIRAINPEQNGGS